MQDWIEWHIRGTFPNLGSFANQWPTDIPIVFPKVLLFNKQFRILSRSFGDSCVCVEVCVWGGGGHDLNLYARAVFFRFVADLTAIGLYSQWNHRNHPRNPTDCIWHWISEGTEIIGYRT